MTDKAILFFFVTSVEYFTRRSRVVNNPGDIASRIARTHSNNFLTGAKP